MKASWILFCISFTLQKLLKYTEMGPSIISINTFIVATVYCSCFPPAHWNCWPTIIINSLKQPPLSQGNASESPCRQRWTCSELMLMFSEIMLEMDSYQKVCLLLAQLHACHAVFPRGPVSVTDLYLTGLGLTSAQLSNMVAQFILVELFNKCICLTRPQLRNGFLITSALCIIRTHQPIRPSHRD